MKKIMKVANVYQIKLAATSEPDTASIKQIIRLTIENLYKTYLEVMDGVLYTTNFTSQSADHNVHVSFDLYLDKYKKELAEKNQGIRDTAIISASNKLLQQKFPGYTFQIFIQNHYA